MITTRDYYIESLEKRIKWYEDNLKTTEKIIEELRLLYYDKGEDYTIEKWANDVIELTDSFGHDGSKSCGMMEKIAEEYKRVFNK